MKKRITPLPVAAPRKTTDIIQSGNLPEPEAVNQAVANLTGMVLPPPTPPPTFAAAPEPPKAVITPPQPQQQIVMFKTFGRPPKMEAIGRDKFTTRLKTELVVALKTRAAQRKITVADLVELIITENIERY